MKGIWILTAIFAVACLGLITLPLNTYAQQPLDEQTADFPNDDGEEMAPDEEPTLPPLDEEEPSETQELLEGDQPEGDQLDDPFGQQASPSSSTTPASSLQPCITAVPKAIFVLNTLGISTGVTYIQAGAHVSFTNPSNSGHDVQIVPSGFFDSDSFRVTINSSVHTKASSPDTITRGRIVVNPGKSETEHYVVICP